MHDDHRDKSLHKANGRINVMIRRFVDRVPVELSKGAQEPGHRVWRYEQIITSSTGLRLTESVNG